MKHQSIVNIFAIIFIFKRKKNGAQKNLRILYGDFLCIMKK